MARATAAAGQHVRGRLLRVIAVTSFALLAILAAAFTARSALAPASGQPGGLLGGRALTVVTAMLVLGGAFVILRAAISHDECSRRLDGLCQELESSNTPGSRSSRSRTASRASTTGASSRRGSRTRCPGTAASTSRCPW